MNKIVTFFLLLCFVQLCDAQYLWYENETNTYQIEFGSAASGTFSTDVPNPDNTGINTNTIVSKFDKAESTTAFLTFNLFNPVIDFTGQTVTFKAYVDVPTALLTPINSRLRMYFTSSTVNNPIFKQLNFTVGQEWQTFTFNFDRTVIPDAVLNTNGYDLIRIGFANGLVAESATTYYFDAINASTDQAPDVTDEPATWLAGSWGNYISCFWRCAFKCGSCRRLRPTKRCARSRR